MTTTTGTVTRLLAPLGISKADFHAKWERSGRLRFCTVTLKNEATYPLAAKIKAAIVGYVEGNGYSGGCDVYPVGPNPTGAKLA